MNALDQKIWEKIEAAATEASDPHREPCPPTAMYFFVREVMSFPWAKWLNDPGWRADCADVEQIADVIEGLHAKDALEFGAFWEAHLSPSDGREEFIALWLATRYPPGTNPLDIAFEDAAQMPIRLESGAKSVVLDKIVSIAYHLQDRAGDRDILLPQELLAARLKVSQRTISTQIGTAVKRGFLVPRSRHDYKNGYAKSYRFRVSLFDDAGREIRSTSNRDYRLLGLLGMKKG